MRKIITVIVTAFAVLASGLALSTPAQATALFAPEIEDVERNVTGRVETPYLGYYDDWDQTIESVKTTIRGRGKTVTVSGEGRNVKRKPGRYRLTTTVKYREFQSTTVPAVTETVPGYWEPRSPLPNVQYDQGRQSWMVERYIRSVDFPDADREWEAAAYKFKITFPLSNGETQEFSYSMDVWSDEDNRVLAESDTPTNVWFDGKHPRIDLLREWYRVGYDLRWVPKTTVVVEDEYDKVTWATKTTTRTQTVKVWAGMTKREYRKIRIGQRYNKVKRIVGGPGTVYREYTKRGYGAVKVIAWEKPNGDLAWVGVQRGRVYVKGWIL